MKLKRAVLSIATGKAIYIQMATNLARSFKQWHRGRSLPFFLVTDQSHLIPPDLADIEVIEADLGQYGQGFSPKLYLDKLAPADKTLFIDADCLCTGSLETVFDQFAGRAVSVIGGSISEGEWFGDVAAVCKRFGIAALPKFNGGLYYLEKGEICDRVYATARELEPQYDEIGLVRMRNYPTDELLMAIAMAMHHQTALPDDGSIMSDPQACPGDIVIDVLRGKSYLSNPSSPHPQHQSWYPFTRVSPVLIHFLGHHTNNHPYRREELRLQLAKAKGWNLWTTDLWATISCSVPLLGAQTIKTILRPVYRRLFGTRPILQSERV